MQPSSRSAPAAAQATSAGLPGWTLAAVEGLFALPFNDLLARAYQVHAAHHERDAVPLSTLLSIKTGGCPEACADCPQAARYHSGAPSEARRAAGKGAA